MDQASEQAPSWQPWLGLALCLVMVLLGTQARVWRATSDANFSSAQPEGLLKSDPALLFYITERIIEAGGSPPADFRADPRVQHPLLTDIPAEFTVGQEFLVAWAYGAFGAGEPLHLFATKFMALLASLAALGIYGVVFWRTRSVGWGLGAAALFCLLPANYRTIGFVLIREDLSLPLFLGHLALLARAEKLRSARAFLWAGLLLALALASWHAMGFFVVLELLALQAWFLWSGRSPFETRGAWAVLVGPILVATLVPALRSAGVLLGPAMQLALALLALAWIRSRYRNRSGGTQLARLPSVACGLLLIACFMGLGAALDAGSSSYSHVFDVLRAKLAFFGERPADPHSMSFDARLLWQGPFETLPFVQLRAFLGWGLWLLPVGLWLLIRGRQRLGGFDAFLILFALGSLPTAWLIGRTVILLGALLPTLVLLLPRLGRPAWVRSGFGVLLILQALSFVDFLDAQRIGWYSPAERQSEITHLVRWVEANLEKQEPIVGDFMNSTAILAHSGNPIVLQPKYETDHSRRRAQLFLETFFEGTPAELALLVRERFESDLLLIDRYTLGALSPWVAGSPAGPRAGSVGALLLSRDAQVLTSLPGYELIYRSPSNADYFRLYRLSD